MKIFKLLVSLVLLTTSATAQVYHGGPGPVYEVSPPPAVSACSAGQYVSAVNGSGSPTCGTPAGTTVGANPTASAGPTAVNGSATTYLRSDGAPAIQLGTNAQKGIVQVDGSTITASAGVVTTANTTVNGTTCTPGSSCTPSPSTVASGATGSTPVITDNSTKLATTAFFNGRPQLHSTLASNQTGLTSATWTLINLPAADIDTVTGWNSSTHLYTIPTTGTYRISGSCDIIVTTASTLQQACAIGRNGKPGVGTIAGFYTTDVGVGTAQEYTLPVTASLFKLTAADTLELDVLITGATTLTVNSGNNATQLSIEWVGP